MLLLVFILALFEGISDRLQAFTTTDPAHDKSAETSSARMYGEEYDYSIFRSDCKRVPVGTATFKRISPSSTVEEDDDDEEEEETPPDKPPPKRSCDWRIYLDSNRIREI